MIFLQQETPYKKPTIFSDDTSVIISGKNDDFCAMSNIVPDLDQGAGKLPGAPTYKWHYSITHCDILVSG
jgi:hypothetical protein